jgi:drug/metabolite transporter (DMT)-like permease
VLAIALALAASLSWGLADFVGGIKSRVLPLLTVMVVSQAVGLAVIAAAVGLRGKGAPDGDFALYAALGAVAGVGGLAAFYRGLAIGAMAVVAPISATAAGIPVVFGLLTGERPSALQVAGIALAIAGVVLASREPPPEGRGAGPRARVAAGAGLALVAALGFGSFFVAMDEASRGDALWAILVNRLTGVGLLAALALAVRPRLALAPADAVALAAVGLFDMGANTLYALATTEGLVSVVAVLSSLYPVVVIALAHFVLGERVRPSQQVGVALALAGVAFIAAG